MADEEDPITITIGEDCEDLDPYRANIATPQNLESMRFWVQQELKQIENAFSRLKDYLDCISGEIEIPSSGGSNEEECEFTICCTEFVEVGGPGYPPTTTTCKEYQCDAILEGVKSLNGVVGYWLYNPDAAVENVFAYDETANGNDYRQRAEYTYGTIPVTLDVDVISPTNTEDYPDECYSIPKYVYTTSRGSGNDPYSFVPVDADVGDLQCRDGHTFGFWCLTASGDGVNPYSIAGFTGNTSGGNQYWLLYNFEYSDGSFGNGFFRVQVFDTDIGNWVTEDHNVVPTHGAGEDPFWFHIIVSHRLLAGQGAGGKDIARFRYYINFQKVGEYDVLCKVRPLSAIAGRKPYFCFGGDGSFSNATFQGCNVFLSNDGSIPDEDIEALSVKYAQNFSDYVDPDPNCAEGGDPGESESFQYEERVIYPKDGQILKYNAAKGCWEYADECCPEVPEFPGYAFNFCSTELPAEECEEYACDALNTAIGLIGVTSWWKANEGTASEDPAGYLKDSAGSTPLLIIDPVGGVDFEYPSLLDNCSGFSTHLPDQTGSEWFRGLSHPFVGPNLTIGGVFKATKGGAVSVIEANARNNALNYARLIVGGSTVTVTVRTSTVPYTGAVETSFTFPVDVRPDGVFALALTLSYDAPSDQTTIRAYNAFQLADTVVADGRYGDGVSYPSTEYDFRIAYNGGVAFEHAFASTSVVSTPDLAELYNAYQQNYEDFVDTDCQEDTVTYVPEPMDGDTIVYNATDGCWEFTPLVSGDTVVIDDSKVSFDTVWSSSKIASEIGGLVPFSQFNQLKLRVANLESIVGVTAAVADGGGAAAPQVFTALDGGSASDADTTFNLAEMLDGGASA